MITELFFLAFGGLVGWIAAILHHEYSSKRIAVYIFTGMLGGIFGGFVGVQLSPSGLDEEGAASASAMMFAVFGATAFVAIAALARDRNSE